MPDTYACVSIYMCRLFGFVCQIEMGLLAVSRSTELAHDTQFYFAAGYSLTAGVFEVFSAFVYARIIQITTGDKLLLRILCYIEAG